jgi:hypothetical protein
MVEARACWGAPFETLRRQVVEGRRQGRTRDGERNKWEFES